MSGPSYADKINIFEFTETELLKLEVRKVRGADNKTEYSVGSNENGNFLKAVADNAASGLGKDAKQAVDEKVKEIKKTEEELFEQISNELENNQIDKGLWTKAEAESDQNQNLLKKR